MKDLLFQKDSLITFLIHVTNKVQGVGKYSANLWGGGYSSRQYLHRTKPVLRWNKRIFNTFFILPL